MKVVLKNSTLQFNAVKEPVKVADGEFSSNGYYNFNYSPSDFGVTETGTYKIVVNPVVGKDRPKYFWVQVYNTSHSQGGTGVDWAYTSSWVDSANEVVGTFTFDVLPAEIGITAGGAVGGSGNAYPIYLDIQVYKLD